MRFQRGMQSCEHPIVSELSLTAVYKKLHAGNGVTVPPLYGRTVYAVVQSEKIGWNRGNYLTPRV